MDEDMKWKMRVLSEYGGRAILAEDKIAHRLGYEIAAFDLCDNAWLLKDGHLPDNMFKREIGPALGFEESLHPVGGATRNISCSRRRRSMSAAGMELLAQIWHAGQYRRGPERTPYIEHPKAVVAKLMEWGVVDDDTLAMAWGHDLLEDTKCPAKAILRVGGQEVLDGIYMLTRDDRRWPEKGGWIAHLAQNAPMNVLFVKAADRLCNTIDFIKAGRKEKAMQYLRDSYPVIARIHEASDEYEQLIKQ